MGLFDKAKEAVGLGGEGESEADEIGESFIDEVDSEVSESDEMLGEEEDFEEEQQEEEWESAYKFAEEFLEVRGFASMVDFTNKCMAYKINQSPLYRDRISNGVDTMNRITTMQEQMQQISGDDSGSSNYAEKAEQLKNANEVIDQAQKLSGEEDAMVNELIGLGHELADSIAQNVGNNNNAQNVNSSVNRSEERL